MGGDITQRLWKTHLSVGKVPATERGLQLIGSLHEQQYAVNAAYYCPLFDQVKLVFQQERQHINSITTDSCSGPEK
jgi:hypothetical protein